MDPSFHDLPDRFPRLYDWEHDPFQDDVVTYLAFARRFGGPVLELACGTGRVLRVLARAGLDCVGVDRSGAMLAVAAGRLQGLAVRLERQTVEHLDLAERFRTILFPLDGLGLLVDRSAHLAALQRARHHATHDARLVLDVSNGNLRGGNEPGEDLVHHLTAPDAVTGRSITKWVVRRPDPAEQVDQLTSFYDELDESGRISRTVVRFELRWFTRFEVELLLEKAGWRVDELYGGYDLSPFGPASERIFVVASPG